MNSLDIQYLQNSDGIRNCKFQAKYQNDLRQEFKFVQVSSEDFYHINSNRTDIVAELQKGKCYWFCSMSLPDIGCLQKSEGMSYGKIQAKYQNDLRHVLKFVQVNSEDFFHINSNRPNIVARCQQGNNHRLCSINPPDIECLQNTEGIS